MENVCDVWYCTCTSHPFPHRWEWILSTSIHYIHEQLAASQQGALGVQKLSHTERTLTMVGVEDGVSPSASH